MVRYNRHGFNGSVEDYIRRIKDCRGLPRNDEIELGLRIRDYGDERAIKELVYHNLMFVISIAKIYRNRGLPFEDLINEGNIGLFKAAKRFDPYKKGLDKPMKFISYAVWWVRQNITSALADKSRVVRLPPHMNGLWFKVEKACIELSKKCNGNPLTSEDVAKELSVKIEDVENVLDPRNTYPSLNSSAAKDGYSTYLDILPDTSSGGPEEIFNDKSLKNHLIEIMSELPKKEGDALDLYYGLSSGAPQTLDEIADDKDISRERARQLKDSAIRRIRENNRRREVLDSFRWS